MQDGERTMALLGTLIAPWSYLTAPVFVGLERVPTDRPVLFVGNHTLMGGLDVPLLMAELWAKKRIVLHSLGDRLHFGLPGWRELVKAFGVIEGSPENCRAAMREGKSIVVFPGGAREVMKRRGEEYKLLWGERCGFARLALETGYTIQPFASVGADDCFDMVIDGNDLLSSPIGGVIERFLPRPDFLPPLVRGIGLSPLPRPERFYFHFAEAISSDPERLGGDHTDPAACRRLRDEVERSVEQGIAELLARRSRDPQRHLRERLWGARPESEAALARPGEGAAA